MEYLWLYTHLSFLALALIGIAMADHDAFDWMRGKKLVLEVRKLHRSHWIVTTGLLGLVYTGLYLFWPLRDYLILQPQFWVKMAFIITLLINSLFIERIMPVASYYSYQSLRGRQKTILLISGAVSSVSWLMTIIAAWYLFGWPF